MSRIGPVDTRGSVPTSSGSITSRMPGTARAAAASMYRIRACAYWLRTIRPNAIPGRTRSPVYLALPVTMAGPSSFGRA
jgi:hypothetical protein